MATFRVAWPLLHLEILPFLLTVSWRGVGFVFVGKSVPACCFQICFFFNLFWKRSQLTNVLEGFKPPTSFGCGLLFVIFGDLNGVFFGFVVFLVVVVLSWVSIA